MKFTEIVPSKVEDSFSFFIPIVGKSYSHYGNRIIPCVGITDSQRGNEGFPEWEQTGRWHLHLTSKHHKHHHKHHLLNSFVYRHLPQFGDVVILKTKNSAISGAYWWYFINPSIGVACTLPSLNPSFSAASLNSS